MGWTSWDTAQEKLRWPTAGDYLAKSYTMTTSTGAVQTVLKHATVGGVWYAAMRVQGDNRPHSLAEAFATPADYTVCVVVLTEGTWGRRWGEKGMDETAGPTESRCPAPVLNLLTPLADHHYAQYARAWRERCRANLGRRAAA